MWGGVTQKGSGEGVVPLPHWGVPRHFSDCCVKMVCFGAFLAHFE